jgi:beta-lactamase superfamily II metal-dependent hydrolase
MKKLFCILFIILINLPVSCCYQENGNPLDSSEVESNKQSETPPVSEDVTDIIGEPYDLDELEIFIFGIGKADAIFITTKNHTVMIDTGENKHGPQIADYLFSRNITEIDYLIITHFHKDHIGGADTIIKNFKIGEVIVPNYGKDSKQYSQFAEAMREADIDETILTETMEFVLDDSKFTVYPSGQEYYYYGDTEDDEENEDDDDSSVNENNFSIAVSVNHGNNNFLFTGDAKSKRLKELLSIDDIINTEYTFLKVPHHGRYNKRSEEFIYAISPEYAVITCSIDSPADDKVINALEIYGVNIYFTSNGDVYCISDGNDLMVSYK